MSLIVVGTNHKFSPIELRERLSFSKNRLKDALFFLKEKEVFKGTVILSTCNRVEIYSNLENPVKGTVEIIEFTSRYHEIDREKILPYLYVYEEKKAIKHLYEVACGLDSLILGETQILGQVKYALSEAESISFVDESLRQIFYSAISFADRMHKETKISEGKVSIGSVAIDFIKEKLGTLQDKNILIIGVGKVSELVLKYLKEESPRVVFVSNRTFAAAEELARQISAKAVRFDDLPHFLSQADAIITATASPHFILRKEALEKTLRHKLLIVDLAVPRDVDPRVSELEGIELFNLEDLESIIQKNLERRQSEAEKVKEIIEREIRIRWQKLIKSEPAEALLP